MLYDLVPLPIRYRDNSEISSIIPIFRGSDTLDDLEWIGWEMEPGLIQRLGCRKYKTVEIYGKDTIERTFVSKEPLDLNKPWWTSTEQIMPIYQKTFRSSDLNTIQTIKYLNGITGMLQLTGVQVCNTKTIHTEILQSIQTSIYQNPKCDAVLMDRDHPLHHITVGDDEKNLDNYIRVQEMRHDPDEMLEMRCSVDWIPAVKDDPYLERFIHADQLTLNEIHLARSLDYGVSMCSIIQAITHPLFDPKEEDVLYGEEDPNKRWPFLRVLILLQTIPATDYNISLTLKNNQVIQQQIEYYNRYKGYGYPNESPDQRYYTDMLFEAFARWKWSHLLQHIREDHPVTKITIQRNWLDEAYILIEYEDGTQQKYYIDFTMYQIASISIMS